MQRESSRSAVVCQGCGQTFHVARLRRDYPTRFCSRRCREATIRPSLTERFWSRIDCSGGPDACWLWRGTTVGNGGYGCLSVNNRLCRAHRISWEMTHGPIPVGLCVCHRCNVKRCVNPAHLYLATVAQNVRDAARDGITPAGDRHYARRTPERVTVGSARPTAKLTEAIVANARRRYAVGDVSLATLAGEAGVHVSTLWSALHRVTWKHVD